ncbi:MotA/TolQ/ExbB proton channel family protein [Mariprofundus erugo]|uniref:MotA/TolQ/ExbB proton channel family protein n=1 Tax=Mariprofundus erugo TaxID=2528639 RepID=A0A5R9GM58_9PROT|nr:MotA/TolQ/ExbB proton channel family protein [Mariprofundus erugo]TLS65377.1 MotA/TolQ/ExbB proton channel family protein [Mariprofundus erugo]
MMARKGQVVDFILNDHTHVTWIIVGMFALGILVSLIQTMKLTGEWFRLYKLESVVMDKGLVTLSLSSHKHTVERFLIALQRITAVNGHPDLETLVDVEFASQHRISQFVSLLGNLMITLGLIGTVLGMTMTMNGLHSALGELGVNQELLLAGLRTAMNGMGTAFYTTLMGAVLGGILLRVFAWITDGSINGLQDLLLRTCIVHAAADLKADQTRDLRLMEAQVDQLEQRFRLLNLAMQASREEMHYLRDEACLMHTEMLAMAEGNPVRKIATEHARYALSVRPGFFKRLFRE